DRDDVVADLGETALERDLLLAAADRLHGQDSRLERRQECDVLRQHTELAERALGRDHRRRLLEHEALRRDDPELEQPSVHQLPASRFAFAIASSIVPTM